MVDDITSPLRFHGCGVGMRFGNPFCSWMCDIRIWEDGNTMVDQGHYHLHSSAIIPYSDTVRHIDYHKWSKFYSSLESP